MTADIVDTPTQAAEQELPPLIVREPLEAFMDEHGLGSGPIEAERVMVTDPAGAEYELALGTRDFTLGRTTLVGVYQLAYLDADGDVVEELNLPVSLASDEESNIAPAETIRVHGVEETLAGGADAREITGKREVRVNREFFTYLLLAILLSVLAKLMRN